MLKSDAARKACAEEYRSLYQASCSSADAEKKMIGNHSFAFDGGEADPPDTPFAACVSPDVSNRNDFKPALLANTPV